MIIRLVLRGRDHEVHPNSSRRYPVWPLPLLAAAMVALCCLGCGPSTAVKEPSSANREARSAEQQRPAGTARQILDTWTGDFDGMVARHRVRALVPYSKTFFFIDRGRPRGLTYELLTAFEKQINEDLKKKTVKVEVVFIPVARDELLPGLLDGRGDIAVGNLTITPERSKLVDFSEPLLSNVRELVVTGPQGPTLASLDDLAGQTVHVRKSSSYYESLLRLNESFQRAGKPEVELVAAPENLEDEDLLEMTNAGLIPAIVVDSHKAGFWAQVFDDVKLHSDVALHSGGQIGWAFRKDSPKLKKVVNGFVRKNKEGSFLGNLLFQRYAKSTRFVKNALAPEELAKFRATVDHIRKYATQYAFDWVIVAAVGYQESGLDQSKRSRAGALGVMQILPSTARDPNVGIPNIEELEPNIHAGVKYLHFLRNRYFSDDTIEPLDRWLLTFAAYNAGPARVSRLRKEAGEMGLDPDKWFRNVEIIAAKRIGRETVQYVSNIYKYYIAYSQSLELVKLKPASF